jgi:WD40 repeat protein
LLYIYRLPEMQQVATLTNLANVSDFAFSPAGNEVAVSSRNGVELWNVDSWARTRVLTNFNNLVYSPEGSTCWLSQEYRSSALYQAASLEPLLPLPAGALPLTVSGDGRHLAVSVNGRFLQLWDLNEVRSQLRELGIRWDAGQSGAPDRH